MKALNLLVLRCIDLERCRTFYETFGMSFTEHAHGKGPEHYACEDSDGVFELYPAKPGAVADQTGLGFGIADLSAAYTTLVAAGFSPSEPTDTAWGRSFVVRDPDGRRVEVKAI